MHDNLKPGAPWPERPHTYELLIRVADAGPSIPHLSTTATVIVHLVPWKASTVAASTHRATVRGGPWAFVGWGKRTLEGEEPQFSRWMMGKAFQRGTLSAKSNMGEQIWGMGWPSSWRSLEDQGIWQGSGEAVTSFQVPSVVTPLLVTDTEAFWQPDPWFVVVLTVTGALLLLALGWPLSRLLGG